MKPRSEPYHFFTCYLPASYFLIERSAHYCYCNMRYRLVRYQFDQQVLLPYLSLLL
uniref:Uncharacterized protein n=1 Tax=Picea glauca TaxID=3330 RepID=A0A101M1H2_PICGL|nr:hypothetical protein ABT39_MTgene3743 [Picea glauca]QHR87496.1 hypothetical protein Q903MT_gene1507 [Picea sitchensis]